MPLLSHTHEFEEEVTEQVQNQNKKIVNDPGGKGKNLWEIPIFKMFYEMSLRMLCLGTLALMMAQSSKYIRSCRTYYALCQIRISDIKTECAIEINYALYNYTILTHFK